MLINKRYLYKTASPRSQEATEVLRCASARVKEIAHIKRILKDSTSLISAPKENVGKNLLLTASPLESPREPCAPGIGVIPGGHTLPTQPHVATEKETRSSSNMRFCCCELCWLTSLQLPAALARVLVALPVSFALLEAPPSSP